MNTALMNLARVAARRRPWMPASCFASTQLTATERVIDRREQPEHGLEYTITEGCSAYTDMVPAWLSEVWEQMQAIAALSDGWDSYGAEAPDSNKLEAAWGLLVCLCQNTDLPKPYVNPTRSGGVQFEWEVGHRYFELEVVSERAATYLYCDDAAHVEETGDVFALEPIRVYIRKVASVQ
jgi:hypothetical protein